MSARFCQRNWVSQAPFYVVKSISLEESGQGNLLKVLSIAGRQAMVVKDSQGLIGQSLVNKYGHR